MTKKKPGRPPSAARVKMMITLPPHQAAFLRGEKAGISATIEELLTRWIKKEGDSNDSI